MSPAPPVCRLPSLLAHSTIFEDSCMLTRTTVELEKVGPLVDGNHENPFELLGPHDVITAGRKAMAVRAFLPGVAQAWLIDNEHQGSQPMRRVHPAGLYEAICPLRDDSQRHRYQLR